MTPGEQMIWAAVFGAEYAKAGRQTVAAIKAACAAVDFARNCLFRADENFDEKQTAMLREMLGEGKRERLWYTKTYDKETGEVTYGDGEGEPARCVGCNCILTYHPDDVCAQCREDGISPTCHGTGKPNVSEAEYDVVLRGTGKPDELNLSCDKQQRRAEKAEAEVEQLWARIDGAVAHLEMMDHLCDPVDIEGEARKALSELRGKS
jgi:hypothetical protein